MLKAKFVLDALNLLERQLHWNRRQTMASQMATDEITAAQSNPRRPI
jgi:hypothetical protein